MEVSGVWAREAVSNWANPVEACKEGRLMVLLGVLLGIVYLLFLAVWVWATRFRPRD